MAVPHQKPRDLPKTELEMVIHWPIIAVAAVLPVLFLAMLVGSVLGLGGPKPTPQQTATVAQRTSPPTQEAGKRLAAPGQTTAAKKTVAALSSTTVATVAQISELPPEVLPAPTPEPEQARQVAAAPAPPPAPPADVRRPEAAKASAPPLAKRPQRLEEYYLTMLLRDAVPEVDLDAVVGSSAKLQAAAKDDLPTSKSATPTTPTKKSVARIQGVKPYFDLLAQRPDLRGLPVRRGADCQTEKKAAETMQAMSRALRLVQSGLTPRKSASSISPMEEEGLIIEFLSHLRQGSDSPKGSKAELFKELIADLGKLNEDMIPTLVQMVQPARAPVRLELVKLLAAIKGPVATAALARRAVFDLAEEVRQGAVGELKQRPPTEYRPILLDGLRYPWAPVADHAADALVTLADREAVPSLVALLDKPDPCAPVYNKENKWVVPELVRVNHLRNCLLCHAPSFDRKDLVRGLVPTPGEPLPVEYYESSRGIFVRADVTYLKQDFSVMHPVANPNEWPELQRHDYFVRQREATAPELSFWAGKTAVWYPQRDAVLFALRQLTGKDAGDSSKDWYQALQGSGFVPSP